MVLPGDDLDRARRVADSIGDAASHPVTRLDASDAGAVEALARAYGVDLVMNAVDPRFLMPVFRGALAADVDYMDMAVSMSTPHPTDPYSQPGIKLGDDQFAMDAAWRDRGRLALVGQGISPGLAQVFAAHAAKHLFDEVHDINIRAGGDLRIEGYPFATVFSIWTTIEECLNPPLVWEKDRGFFTLPPFAEPERFIFPEGIGPVECVHVEHEDIVMIPRVLDARRVTFKFALGEEFIGALKVLHAIGLDRTDPIEVDGQQVRPRNVVSALVPDPATLGDHMTGRVIVGTHVTGLKDGKPREIFATRCATPRTPCAASGCSRWRGRPASTRSSRWSCSPTGAWRGGCPFRGVVRSRCVPRHPRPRRHPPRHDRHRARPRLRLTGRTIPAATLDRSARVGQ